MHKITIQEGLWLFSFRKSMNQKWLTTYFLKLPMELNSMLNDEVPINRLK